MRPKPCLTRERTAQAVETGLQRDHAEPHCRKTLVDVMTHGPPCQPFSLLGKKKG
ncbi:DNA cytosine methyltransferase [Paractinoplanes pyxinae]|uniref:DNA cytosine methyltransferase n=1 Tax=Paractinoplanes pyxinae TaxID=2997416 RepID=UPI0034DB23B9